MELSKKIILLTCLTSSSLSLHSEYLQGDLLLEQYKKLQSLQNEQNNKISELSTFVTLQKQKQELAMQLNKTSNAQEKQTLTKKLQNINTQLADLTMIINKKQAALATSQEAQQLKAIKKELIQNKIKR